MSKAKDKGTKWERDTVSYLVGRGYDAAERRALAGVLDKGDVVGIPDTVIECKAEVAFNFSGYMKELAAEMVNANAKYGAAVVKRPGKNVADAYAVMPLSLFVTLLRAVHGND